MTPLLSSVQMIQRHLNHTGTLQHHNRFDNIIQQIIILPFNALTLLVGRQEEHPACKKLGVDIMVVTI